MDVLIKIVQVIVSLGLLIILHEGGHFLFAKLFKTRVEKFYLFFDYKFHIVSTYDKWMRRLFHKKPVPKKENGDYEYQGTEYGIGWIPLGGYVKIAGMIDESMDKEQMKQPPQPWEFRTKPAWQRLLIMLGGVIMNFIVAFLLYAMVIFVWGENYVKTSDLTYGMKFSEQAKADGFQDGDLILGVDDETFDFWNSDIQGMVHFRMLANAKTAHVLRAGKKVDIKLPEEMNLLEMLEEPRYVRELTPLCLAYDSIKPTAAVAPLHLKEGNRITAINNNEIKDWNDVQYAMMNIAKSVPENATAHDSLLARTIQISFTDADTIRTEQVVANPDFLLGIQVEPVDYPITHRDYGFFESFPAGVAFGWAQLKGYVSDLKYIFTKKGARSVGGFIAIGNIFPSQWDWHSFWLLTALLSIILGFMNLLPIPALDGGHALFAIYEIITRRKPSDKFLERAQYVGMFILFGILIFANLNDILRLFGI